MKPIYRSQRTASDLEVVTGYASTDTGFLNLKETTGPWMAEPQRQRQVTTSTGALVPVMGRRAEGVVMTD